MIEKVREKKHISKCLLVLNAFKEEEIHKSLQKVTCVIVNCEYPSFY